MNSHTKKNKEREILNFFQIQIEASLSDFTDLFTEVELEKIDLSKKIFVRNNESIITPENWEQHKETFFNQRIATYKNDYTFTEKIKLEVSKLKNLNTKINDYKVLKDRYNIFLEQKQPNNEPFQTLVNPFEKQKPELNGKLIKLKNSEAIEKIHSELKGYFPKKEAELLKALQGEQLSEILLFPHNQNKFVEVFRRLKYNGFLLNNDTEIKNWICTTFHFEKKGFNEPHPFNENSVWDILNKGKGEPTRKQRITIEWLKHKTPDQLKKETENEKL